MSYFMNAVAFRIFRNHLWCCNRFHHCMTGENNIRKKNHKIGLRQTKMQYINLQNQDIK